MPTVGVHVINKYFNIYNDREIAFNKSVIRVSGLEPKKVFLKILGEQLSCVIYSCSMNSAKILVNMDTRSYDQLKKAKNFVNLRFSFLPIESKFPIAFFVPSHVTGYKNFNSANKNLVIMSLDFTKRPPDDLIEIIGKIIYEKENFEKRKDIRIALEGKVIWDIGLATNRGVAIIDNLKRPCILKNLSVNGCFIVMACLPKFVMDKKVIIYLMLSHSNQSIPLEGIIVRSEEVPGRKDIHGLGVLYNLDNIPLEYKRMINVYIDKLEEMAKQK